MKKQKILNIVKSMGIVILPFLPLLLLFFFVLNNKPYYVESHNVCSDIEVQLSNIGTVDMGETISFKNEDGEVVKLTDVLFKGSTEADIVYVYKIGFTPFLRRGYSYLVTDELLEPVNK